MRNGRTGEAGKLLLSARKIGQQFNSDPFSEKRLSISDWARPGLIAACLAVTASACSSSQALRVTEVPEPTPTVQTTLAAEKPAETAKVAEAEPQPEAPVEQTATLPPAPEAAPREVAQAAPIPAEKPEAKVENVVDVVTVTEKPAETTETVEVVETDDQIVARVESTTQSEQVVDRVEVDHATGQVKEEIDVVETTQTTSDTIVVDKATGDTMETVEVGRPRQRVVRSAKIELVPGTPRDPRRLFAGPEQFPASQYAAYAVVAIRADAPASDRQRIKMICEAFVSSQAAETDGPNTDASQQMVTIWPVSSTDRAADLNRAPRNQICQEAVDRYGLAVGHRAILDTEKTGWILDNPGPYLLAWAPGSVKGEFDARILLLDLSGVTEPRQAVELMQDWSQIERNRDMWTDGGWDLETVQALVGSWSSAMAVAG